MWHKASINRGRYISPIFITLTLNTKIPAYPHRNIQDLRNFDCSPFCWLRIFGKDKGLLPQTGKFVVQKSSMRKSCESQKRPFNIETCSIFEEKTIKRGKWGEKGGTLFYGKNTATNVTSSVTLNSQMMSATKNALTLLTSAKTWIPIVSTKTYHTATRFM